MLVHIGNFFVQKAGVASLDSLDRHAVNDRFADHRADRGVHSGRVAAAGQNSYRMNFIISHRCLLSIAVYRKKPHVYALRGRPVIACLPASNLPALLTEDIFIIF